MVAELGLLDLLWWLEGDGLVVVEDQTSQVGHGLLRGRRAGRLGRGPSGAPRQPGGRLEATVRSAGWRQRWALHALDGARAAAAPTPDLLAAADEALRGGRADLALRIADRWLATGSADDDPAAADEMRTVIAVALARSGEQASAFTLLDTIERNAASRPTISSVASPWPGRSLRSPTECSWPAATRLHSSTGSSPTSPPNVSTTASVVAAGLLLHVRLSAEPSVGAEYAARSGHRSERHPEDPILELQVLAVRHSVVSNQPDVTARAVQLANHALLLAEAIGNERLRFQALLMALSTEVHAPGITTRRATTQTCLRPLRSAPRSRCGVGTNDSSPPAWPN